MKTVNNWLNIIQDYLFPPTCLLCGSAGIHSQDICSACCADLATNNNFCYCCAAAFTTPESTPGLCGQCLKKRPEFEETYAPYLYQNSMQYLIKKLKFDGHYKNARLLGHLLAKHLHQNAELPDLIIPVPLHPIRYQQRGFNQALEIARHVANDLGVPLDMNSCIRQRNTVQQLTLPAKQRRRNLRNAFCMQKTLSAAHIAIIDDVMTTGTTVNELAKVLLKAGAARVDVWVCARA